MGLPLLAIPAAIGLGKSIYGLIRGNQARSGLAELERQPYPEFASGQDIFNEANTMATGLSPQEKAYAESQVNRLNNQRYKLATDRNPTLSGVTQAGINFGSVQGALDLASRDAQARRQNLNQLIGLIGGQKNMQTSSEIQRRREAESAYGQSAATQDQNVFTGLQDIANPLLSYGLNEQYLKMLGGMGGARTASTDPAIGIGGAPDYSGGIDDYYRQTRFRRPYGGILG